MPDDDLSDRLRLTDEARRQLGLLMNWREERDELPDDWPMDLDLFVLTSNVEPLLSDAEEAADRLDDGVLLDRDARMAVSRVATMVECPECGCVELTQCSGGELDIGHGIHIARLERVKRQFEALHESGGGE